MQLGSVERTQDSRLGVEREAQKQAGSNDDQTSSMLRTLESVLMGMRNHCALSGRYLKKKIFLNIYSLIFNVCCLSHPGYGIL